jgi:hypothetical protein
MSTVKEQDGGRHGILATAGNDSSDGRSASSKPATPAVDVQQGNRQCDPLATAGSDSSDGRSASSQPAASTVERTQDGKQREALATAGENSSIERSTSSLSVASAVKEREKTQQRNTTTIQSGSICRGTPAKRLSVASAVEGEEKQKTSQLPSDQSGQGFVQGALVSPSVLLAPTSVRGLEGETRETNEEPTMQEHTAASVLPKATHTEAVELQTEESGRVASIEVTTGSGETALYMSGQLEGETVRFLIDTGAEVTVIGPEVLARLPRETRLSFLKKDCTIVVASGERVPARGPVLCRLKVADREVLEPVRALLVNTDCILGYPTCRALGCQLTVAGVQLCSTAPPPVRVREIQAETAAKVRVLNTVEIPPLTESLVVGRVNRIWNGRAIVIEPLARNEDEDKQFVVARSVDVPEERLVKVRVCNPTAEPVVLKSNSVVAEVQRADVLAQEGETDNNQDGNLPAHLEDFWKSTCAREKLPPEVTEKLKQLLCKFSRLFATGDNDLGRTTVVTHDINTGDAAPIRQPPRRIPEALMPEFDKEMDRMLMQGVISPGQSPWASPVVLVRKKDGSIRFCVDYRRLNAKTRFDAYPLPRIDETLESLGGTKYFSTLDLLSGYWQVGLTEEARLKSAFTTRNGLFVWNVMPFGLCNAPSTFERLMETVLRGLQWQQCLVYLDDVVVFAQSENQMLERLDTVFSRLLDAGLKLKPRKCSLFSRKTEYLGHIVSEEGIHVSPTKVSAITEWPVPETVTELRSFLGTANYYRRFVKGFSQIAAPLFALTGGEVWVWTPAQQEAFDQLKQALATAPVLKFPVKGAPYILDTDASNTGIGGVLSQIVDGREMVLGYMSKSLSSAERNYCVTRRELLAVYESLRHFHYYLYGRHFVVRTDHSALRWLKGFRNPERQLARWLVEIEQYNFDIEHRPGARHGNADGLSRQPCRQCKRNECDNKQGKINPDEETVTVRLMTLEPQWSMEDLKTAQQDDPDIKMIAEAVATGERPTEISAWSRDAKRYLGDWPRMHLTEGVVWRQWFDNRGHPTHPQYLCPRSLRNQVLQQAHDNPWAGHFAYDKTIQRARQRFCWVGMSADVRNWIASCTVCQSRRRRPTVPHHPLERQVASEPLQVVAIDILTIEPATDTGYKHVLVIVDYATKWVEAIPMKDMKTVTCAEAFIRNFVLIFGIPEQLHSDRGVQFTSKIWNEMCRLLRIHSTKTTALHPQGDGQTERANSILLSLLAKTDPKQWDRQLPFALAAYRSSVHRVTGETPNRLMLGREVRTPLSLLVPWPQGTPTSTDWTTGLKQRFEEAHQSAVESAQASHRAEQPRLDRRQKGLTFQDKDLVWLWDPKPSDTVSHKLRSNWSGPWQVIRVITGCTYTIQRIGSAKSRTVNVDRMLPYVERSAIRFPPPVPDPDEVILQERDENSDVHSETDEGEPLTGTWPQEERDTRRMEEEEREAAAEEEEEQLAPVIVTRRAKRNCRPPAWHRDYVHGSEDEDQDEVKSHKKNKSKKDHSQDKTIGQTAL